MRFVYVVYVVLFLDGLRRVQAEKGPVESLTPQSKPVHGWDEASIRPVLQSSVHTVSQCHAMIPSPIECSLSTVPLDGFPLGVVASESATSTSWKNKGGLPRAVFLPRYSGRLSCGCRFKPFTGAALLAGLDYEQQTVVVSFFRRTHALPAPGL
jgi:hypothetical protein